MQVLNEPEQTSVITKEALARAMDTLRRYQAGKANLDRRIVENEQWWKLRHWEQIKEQDTTGLRTRSAWLVNVLLSKHAESDRAPFFEGDNLVIPFAAPRDCRYWELKLKPQEKIDLFLRLGVPEEKLTMYFSPRALDVARGLTNVSGVPAKKKDGA